MDQAAHRLSLQTSPPLTLKKQSTASCGISPEAHPTPQEVSVYRVPAIFMLIGMAPLLPFSRADSPQYCSRKTWSHKSRHFSIGEGSSLPSDVSSPHAKSPKTPSRTMVPAVQVRIFMLHLHKGSDAQEEHRRPS